MSVPKSPDAKPVAPANSTSASVSACGVGSPQNQPEWLERTDAAADVDPAARRRTQVRTPVTGQDVLYEFPVRISVRAGDRIALDRDAKAGGIFHSYGPNAAYAAARFAPALADDASGVTPGSSATGRELLLNVDVEPDADGDGF